MENFIKITKESFPESFVKNTDVQFRSFEKFLERHSREFEIDDFENIITVQVKNEIDAIKLAENAKLKSIVYYGNNINKEIVIDAPRKFGRPKNTVFINNAKKGMTINQFKKYTLKELQKTYLTKTQIVKNDLITKSQLEKYLAKGELKAIKHGNKILIDRKDVLKLI